MERVDRIFEASDKNRDGCLDQEEFADLIRTVNPETVLNDAQLELIQEEVWAAFPAQIAAKGLTLQGLKRIYQEGYADLNRDYDALIKARSAAAAVGIEHVSGGRLGMAAAARGRQPALADASPLPATPGAQMLPASPDIFGALATPCLAATAAGLQNDIFDAVQTPAPSDDSRNALAFAVRLPGITSELQFEGNGVRRLLLSALKEALPERTATRIASTSATPHGLSVGVVCCLPDGAMGGEEEVYFSAVLGAEPEQVFPLATFGHLEVLSADANAAQGGAIAASAAAEVLAATTLSGTPGKLPFAFAVRLADVTPTEFKRQTTAASSSSSSSSSSKGGAFMAQIRAALPPGCAARVISVYCSAGGGSVVTVVGAVPLTEAQHAQQMIRKLRHDPGTIFDRKLFGSTALIAANHSKTPLYSGVGVKVRLPGRTAEDVLAPADIAAALERALPEGSSAAVRCVEDSSRGGGTSPAAVITLAAALPAGMMSDGAFSAALATMKNTAAWMPTSSSVIARGSSGGGATAAAECLLVGSALEAGFRGCGGGGGSYGDDDLSDLQFGFIPTTISTTTTTTSTTAASREASPTRSPRSPSLFGRLFGHRTAAAVQPDTQEEEEEENVNLRGEAPSPVSPPLNAIIAGYQRKAPSSGGSSGLADIDVRGCDGEEEDHHRADSAAAAAAEAAEVEVSPLKGDKIGSGVINVTAIAAAVYAVPPAAITAADGENGDVVAAEEVGSLQGKKKGWLSRMATSLSPQKRGGLAAAATAVVVGVGGAAAMDETAMGNESLDAAAAGISSININDNGNRSAAAVPELGPRAMTPWEVQQHINGKEWAIMDAHVGHLLANLQYALDHHKNNASVLENEISSIQDSASMMPPWARHAAHMDVGDKLATLKMYGSAARSFREAAGAWPDDPLARFRLGNVHFAQHEYMDASRAYFDALQRCADDDPLLVKIHINMGISMESECRMDTAEREYAKAALLAPNHPRIHKLLGSARLALGNASGAATALERALEINPDFADAWADLGCAHAAMGAVPRARECLSRAIALDSGHIEAHFNFGNVERQAGNLPAALYHYDRVLTLEDQHWRSWLNKAVVVAKMGGRRRDSEAAVCLQRAVDLCPGQNGAGGGAGGVLGEEVEALREMLMQGAAMELLSQQVTVIEDRARAAAGNPRSGVKNKNNGATLSGAASLSVSAGGAKMRFVSPRGRAPAPQQPPAGAESPSPLPSPPQQQQEASSPTHSASHSVSQGRRNSRSASIHSLSPSKLNFSSPEQLRGWRPPLHVQPSDFGSEVVSQLAEMGVEPTRVVGTLDMTLLQALQPVSALTLEDIWAAAVSAEDEIFSSGKRVGPRVNSSSSLSSPNKAAGLAARGKLVSIASARSTLQRLVTSRAQSHLVRPAVEALCNRVLGLMDFGRTGSVDIAVLLCVLSALVDAPGRDRLDLTYKLLMWRTKEERGGKEDPVTRKHLVELLSTLKMVFELQHKTSYLTDRRGANRAADSQFVLYERFASEVQRFFWAYEALPVLCNPLSS